MNLAHMLRYKNRYVMFDALNAAFFKGKLPRIPIQYDSTLTAQNASARIYLPKNDEALKETPPVLLISDRPAVYFDSIAYYAELVAHELCHLYSFLCEVKDTDYIENPDIWQITFQRRRGTFQYHNKEFYISAQENGLARPENLIGDYNQLIEIMQRQFPGKYDDVLLDEAMFDTLTRKIGFNSCIGVDMDILNEYLPKERGRA